KFLNCFLRNSRARCVDRIVCVVGAVNLDQVRAAALTTKVQAGGGRWPNWATIVASDSRGGQRESQIVSFIDRKILDTLQVDRGGDGRFGSFHQLCRSAGDRYYFADLSHFQRDVQIHS